MSRQTKLARLPPLAVCVLATAPMIVVACKRQRTAAECEALWSSADRQIEKVLIAPSTCTRDDECELVEQANGCLSSCDSAIARSKRAEYDATKARLQSGECKDWQEGGCLQTTGRAEPVCVPLTLRCLNGQCAAINPHSK